MFRYSGWAFCAVSKALKCVAARSPSLGELSGSALWRIRLACWAGTKPAIAGSRWRSGYSAVLAETRPDSRCWLFDPCGTCHPFSSSHQFLLCERERVKKGLHRGLAEAPAALMRPLLVVVDEPGIEIGLQFLDRAIDLFTERHPIELVEQRAMEALADPVGLWALGLGAAVIDVLDRQV